MQGHMDDNTPFMVYEMIISQMNDEIIEKWTKNQKNKRGPFDPIIVPFYPGCLLFSIHII